MSTPNQRSRADNRREWWVRFEWAMNATYSPDPLVRSDGWGIVRV
ncbi:hypothetical protein [Gordonia phthalatica]|nr:hypothetical protein [Gordonia phthalatica]